MSEADTAVIIPTVSRPELLRTALESVAVQTARSRIKVVRVLENGGDQRSRDLCAEFAKELPIDYVFRQPGLSAFEHGRLIHAEDHGAPTLAILHDDDWWVPTHLETSLRVMQRTQAIAVYSGFFEVFGESAPVMTDGNINAWFGCNYPKLTQPWRLGLKEVLLASFWSTPGRYSTLVVNAQVFRFCGWICDLNNPFDNDRMLSTAFAQVGDLAFVPTPGAFIRTHLGQDSRSFAKEAVIRRMIETTLWLIDVAQEAGIDLMSEFRQRLEECPLQHRKALLTSMSTPWLLGLLQSQNAVPPLLQEFISPRQE